MEIVAKQPITKAPAETFTGDAWFDVIARGEGPSRLRVDVVRFAPGARNAWHSHAAGQTLHVTEGRGLIQSRGGDVIESARATPSAPRPANGTGTARPPTIS
jgi:quercetin dioxygenase-like cupin family protein